MPEENSSVFRGLAFALPIGLALWSLILGVVFVVEALLGGGR